MINKRIFTVQWLVYTADGQCHSHEYKIDITGLSTSDALRKIALSNEMVNESLVHAFGSKGLPLMLGNPFGVYPRVHVTAVRRVYPEQPQGELHIALAASQENLPAGFLQAFERASG